MAEVPLLFGTQIRDVGRGWMHSRAEAWER
jgi:hypothetical protein